METKPRMINKYFLLFQFGCIFIGALFLFRASKNEDIFDASLSLKIVGESTELENIWQSEHTEIENYELKTWNRSKSIGFLRKYPTKYN